MKNNQTLRLCSWYAVFLCLILAVLFFVFLQTIKKGDIEEQDIQTEWIYVYIQNEESVSVLESDTTASGWILRAYHGRIGIFEENGTLVNVLDTYIKTLPKADQELLEEGIYASNQEKLNSLIEDYSE